MSVVSGVGQITIGLRPWAEVMAGAGAGGAPIGVPDLVRLLDAVQKAVFASAARELHLPGIRNLSDDQRRHHTLALLGLRAGDLVFELAPLAAFQQTGAPTLFSAADLAQVARDAGRPVVATAGRAVDALAAEFAGSLGATLERDDAMGRYAVAMALTALSLRHTVEVTVTEQSGAMHTLLADEASSLRVLALDAVERGELEQFPGCVVRDVVASQCALYVEMPAYGGARVRCEYEREAEDDYSGRLRAGDRVTILGVPSWRRRAQRDGEPDVIAVTCILDENGEIIGHRTLRHLLRGMADELLSP